MCLLALEVQVFVFFPAFRFLEGNSQEREDYTEGMSRIKHGHSRKMPLTLFGEAKKGTQRNDM